jgi:serine/threonine protein kinase
MEDAFSFCPLSEDEWKARHLQPYPANPSKKGDKARSFIGEGSFGVVRRMQNISDRSVVAVKTVSIEGHSSNEVKKEAKILGKLRHKNIIEFRDLVFNEEDTKMHLIMEYAETSLAIIYLQDSFDQQSTEKIVKGIASALDYIHGCGVIHRDLKLENVLIKDGRAKVADFGLSSETDSSVSLRGSVVGTIAYFSPERANRGKYGLKADLWAVGCIIWEVSALRRLEFDFWKVEESISRMVLDCGSKSPLLARMVSQLLQVDPLKRICALTLRTQLNQPGGADPAIHDRLTLPSFRWHPKQLAGLERSEFGEEFRVGYYSVAPGAEGRAKELTDSVLEYVASSHPINRGALRRLEVVSITALDSELSSAHFRTRVAKLQASAAKGWRRPPFNPDWDQPEFTRYPGDMVVQNPADIERRQGVRRALHARPDRLGAGPEGAVRVHTVFHACRDRATALSICVGGFWALSTLDAGYYGKGFYFAGEMDYALRYGWNMLDADGCATARARARARRAAAGRPRSPAPQPCGPPMGAAGGRAGDGVRRGVGQRVPRDRGAPLRRRARRPAARRRATAARLAAGPAVGAQVRRPLRRDRALARGRALPTHGPALPKRPPPTTTTSSTTTTAAAAA